MEGEDSRHGGLKHGNNSFCQNKSRCTGMDCNELDKAMVEMANFSKQYNCCHKTLKEDSAYWDKFTLTQTACRDILNPNAQQRSFV
jgi:hypothetical protein